MKGGVSRKVHAPAEALALLAWAKGNGLTLWIDNGWVKVRPVGVWLPEWRTLGAKEIEKILAAVMPKPAPAETTRPPAETLRPKTETKPPRATRPDGHWAQAVVDALSRAESRGGPKGPGKAGRPHGSRLTAAGG